MTETPSCCVCSEAVTPAMEAWCNSCGSAYHLNQRTDVEAKDCGQVWINQEHLALEFACDTCLGGGPPELDDVLDLTEAAEAGGVTEEWLAAEVAAGRVPHRKTAGGVLLFVRRDVPSPRSGDA